MTTRNGFANPETENVSLWLANNRPLYDAANRLQGTWFGNPEPSDRAECLRAFANALRGFCVRQWPTLETPDGHGLGNVDWLEIAAHWVEP